MKRPMSIGSSFGEKKLEAPKQLVFYKEDDF